MTTMKWVSTITEKNSGSTEDSKSAETTQTDEKLSISTKHYPANWQEQVEQIIGGMREYNINLGENRNPDSLLTRQGVLLDLSRQIIEMETRLDQLRDDRNEQRVELWRFAVSSRQAVLGLYGSDSMQYQALGGTRTSDRKSPKRKSKA